MRVNYDELMNQADGISDPVKKAEAYKKIQEAANLEASGGDSLSGRISALKYQDELKMKSGAQDLITSLMLDQTARTTPEEFRGVGGGKKREMYVQELADQGHIFRNEDLERFYGKEEVVRPGIRPGTDQFSDALVAGLGSLGMDPGKIKQYKDVYGPDVTEANKTLMQRFPGMSLAEARQADAAAGRKPEDEAKDDIAIRKASQEMASKDMQMKYGRTGMQFDPFTGEPQFAPGDNQEKYYEDFYNAEKGYLKNYGKMPIKDFYKERAKDFLRDAGEDRAERIRRIQAMYTGTEGNRNKWTEKQIAEILKELGWD